MDSCVYSTHRVLRDGGIKSDSGKCFGRGRMMEGGEERKQWDFEFKTKECLYKKMVLDFGTYMYVHVQFVDGIGKRFQRSLMLE